MTIVKLMRQTLTRYQSHDTSRPEDLGAHIKALLWTKRARANDAKFLLEHLPALLDYTEELERKVNS